MKNITAILFVLFILVFQYSYAKESYLANSSEPSGYLDLDPNKSVQKLFPLEVVSVNGGNIIRKKDVIWLKPGSHTLKFIAHVDFNYLSGSYRTNSTNLNQRRWNDTLVIEVEDNKKYQLAFDASAKKFKDWKPVILKVTDR